MLKLFRHDAIVALACALGALGLAAGVRAQDTQAAGAERELGNDTFIFGGTVRVDKPAPADLIAAGGSVDVDAAVAGDAMLAGGNVRINASVGHDVYAAGGRLTVDGAVGRNLRAAGGQVELGPQGSVAGNVTVGGGQVTLRGAVKGAVKVGGGRVLIDGPVDGDVVATAGQLALGPNARLGGGLRYSSRAELERDPAAQVAGAVVRRPSLATGAAGARQHERDEHGLRARFAGGWLWTLGLMAAAALLVGALPLTSQRVAQALRTRWALALLLGFVVLVCLPVAALILLITIIGIPVALLVMLLYLALLLLAYLASGVALGQWALARWKAQAAADTGWRSAAAALAVLLLALVGRLPLVGGFVVLVAVLAGLGAIALQLAPRKPVPPAPQTNASAA